MKNELTDLPDNAIEQVKTYLLNLQDRICKSLATIDGQGQFNEESWNRPLGGGGITRILTEGKYLPKLVSIFRMYQASNCLLRLLLIVRNWLVVVLAP